MYKYENVVICCCHSCSNDIAKLMSDDLILPSISFQKMLKIEANVDELYSYKYGGIYYIRLIKLCNQLHSSLFKLI